MSAKEGDATSPGRKRRKDARPGEILDAAMVEFAASGFAGTRLTEVARRAGVSHGTIYNYFDSKETLFRALFRSRLVESIDPAPFHDALAGRTVEETLSAALRIAFRLLAGSDAMALVRILLVEAERFPDLARDCHEEIFGKVRFLLALLIEQGIARGEITAGALRDHPTLLLSPVLSVALFGPLSGSPDWMTEGEAQITAFVEILTQSARRT